MIERTTFEELIKLRTKEIDMKSIWSNIIILITIIFSKDTNSQFIQCKIE